MLEYMVVELFKPEKNTVESMAMNFSRRKLDRAELRLNSLNTMFSKHNLSQLDMIALSRAHTVGFSHCQELTPSIAINMDHVTPQTFDNTYFQNLVEGKGLFTSDQVLFIDPASQPTVNDLASNPVDSTVLTTIYE
ncbi:Peroxidase [Forsythia ovata]|uniref:peroxidase n=1 Tax=Forsythia ovata TaxID=205694 RepID=A0ABD1X1A4_9LAMI